VAEKIALDEVKALRLQLAIAHKANAELKAQAVLKAAKAVVDAAWVDVGLRLDTTYELDFNGLTAIEVAPDQEK
jgi:hypothetical protein